MTIFVGDLVGWMARRGQNDCKSRSLRDDNQKREEQLQQHRQPQRDAELLRFDRGFFDGGKKEGKDRTMVDGVLVAAEGETALVASDDAGGDPETEAGAVEVLGGVEGLEEAGLHGGGH